MPSGNQSRGQQAAEQAQEKREQAVHHLLPGMRGALPLLVAYRAKGLAKVADRPNSTSISSRRLYFAIRSLRQADPVLI